MKIMKWFLLSLHKNGHIDRHCDNFLRSVPSLKRRLPVDGLILTKLCTTPYDSNDFHGEWTDF